MKTPPSRPPVSAYIRTRNESRLIGETVEAALQIAREVVVIDSGSSDDTLDKARAAGARIIEHEWAGYGFQKRIAEDACAHDWLLDLDADEIVTPALAAEIAALFKDGAPSEKVFETPMAVASPVGGVWRGFGLQKRTKLYDRRAIRMPADLFWDQFKIPPGLPVGRVREPIIHYAVEDADQLMRKLNKYSTDRAKTAKPRPKSVVILRIFFGLPVYFLQRYFLEGFFRGGVYGFSYALMTSFRRWLVDVKRYEILVLSEKEKARSV